MVSNNEPAGDDWSMTMLSHVLIENIPEPVVPMLRKWPGCLKRIAVTWDAVMNFVVPLGYQDKNGFHYGAPPAPDCLPVDFD